MRPTYITAWALLATLGMVEAAVAQSATISPSSGRASELETLAFEIGARWAYDVEVEFFTEDRTAVAGEDYQGIDSWRFCVTGDNDLNGVSDGCEFGSPQQTEMAYVVHYRDDVDEGDETYRVVARVTQWETGAVEDGLPVVRECSSTNCGRATATGTIENYEEEPEPEDPGQIGFTTDTASVNEGSSIRLDVTLTPASSSRHDSATVDWATMDGDAARAGRDYTAGSGTLRFSSCSRSCGEQTRSITVRTRQDNVIEGGTHNDKRWEETFLVELSNPTNAELGRRGNNLVQVSIVDDDSNEAPTVTITTSATSVGAGDAVTLTARASDSDGSIRAYRWSEKSGRGSFSDTTTRSTTWHAPDVNEDATYELEVEVHDNDGATTTTSVEISATASGNASPEVQIGSADSVASGSSILIFATAIDADGTVDSYQWSGGGTFSDTRIARPRWYPPAVEVETVYTVSVTVTDDDGATASASKDITVTTQEPNRPPTVTATASPTSTTGGGQVSLSATASDPDNNAIQYEWTGAGTFSSPFVRSPTWTAPRPHTETVYTLQVSASDGEGGFGTDTVEVTVAASTPTTGDPTVSASASKTSIESGERITVTATAADQGGSIASYGWYGPAEGTFGDATAAQTSWTAPVKDHDNTYTLTVTVTDNDGNRARASVDIAVAANAPPTVSVTASKTAVYSGERVDLTATASDSDGRIASYTWRGNGTFSRPTAASTTWTAPSTDDEVTYTVEVTVTDDDGATGKNTADIRVKGPKPIDDPEVDQDPVVQMESVSVREGTSERLVLTLDRRPPSGASLRYKVGNTSGIADGGTDECKDYEFKEGTLNLSNRTSAEISITALKDDCTDEKGESVAVVFEDPAKVSLEYDTLNVAIVEVHGEISFDPEAETESIVPEGNTVRLKVVRPISEPGQRVPASVEVYVSQTSSNKVVELEDYEIHPKVIRFGANQTSATVSISALHDEEHSEDEVFRVELRNPAGATLADYYTSHRITIEDADTHYRIRVSIRADTGIVKEGDTARCTVSLEEANGERLDAPFRMVAYTSVPSGSGAATAGTDFVETREWITFDRSPSQTRTFSVKTIATQENRGDKKFTCRIGANASNADFYDYTGSYTVTPSTYSADDNVIKIENVNVIEQTGNGNPVWGFDHTVLESTEAARIELHRNVDLPVGSDGTVSPMQVFWSTTTEGNPPNPATPNEDYTPSRGSFTFTENGPTSYEISIPVACDHTVEEHESFYLAAEGFADGNGIGSTASVLVTIDSRICASAPAYIAISDSFAIEGEAVEFTVTTSEALDESVYFDWRTVNWSATAGADYTAASGERVRIVRGETSATFTVDTLADDVRDSAESFLVRLSNAVSWGGVPVKFIDDEAYGRITESLPIEGEFYGVPRKHESTPFTVRMRFGAELTATAEEFAAAVTLSAGTVTAEKLSANRWTLTVTPADVSNITIGFDHTAVSGEYGRTVGPVESVTVYGRVTASIADQEAMETEPYIDFPVTLDQPAREQVWVDWETADGTAVSGRDYEGGSGRLNFKPGVAEQNIRVKLFQTTEEEDDETFTVTISPRSGPVAVGDNATATGTIKDSSVGATYSQPATPRTDDSNFSFVLRFHPPVPNMDLGDFRSRLGRYISRGARVVSVARQTAGDDQNFVVTIDPDEEQHVEIVLAHGTPVGDRKMQYDLRMRFPGPLSLGIDDAEATEGTDTSMQFTVTLNQDPPAWAPGDEETVTVEYTTEDDTATAGTDYTTTSGTLSFSRGNLSQTIDVEILADEVDEGEEQFKVTLSNATNAGVSDGEGIGTIKNDGPMPIGLVARFGRAMATHVVDQVEQRIEAPRGASDYAAFSGQLTPLARQLLDREQPGRRPERNGHELDPLAGGLSFGQQTRGGGVLAFWSRSAQSSFNATEGALRMGGDIRTTMVGADYTKDRTITGVALARSLGTGNFAGRSQGEVTAAVTGVYPWIGYQATERVSVWGVAGYGAGNLMLTTEGGPQTSATSMLMTAGGTRGDVIARPRLNVAVKADVLWVGTSVTGSKGTNGNLGAARAAVTRVRTGIEGSRSYTVLGRVTLQPIVEVGLRRDGGDAEQGAGIDLGGGLMVADRASGLAVDMRVRTVVVHQAEEFSERGVAVTFSYNPTSTPHGLRARIAPAWGANATGSADTLWRGDVMSRVGYGDRRGRLDGEIGYGLPLGRLTGTPRVGFSNASHGRMYRIGYGVTAAESDELAFELAIEVQRSESMQLPDANHGATARTSLSW